jgi:cobalamin biosynthesis protein CobD/CbiB
MSRRWPTRLRPADSPWAASLSARIVGRDPEKLDRPGVCRGDRKPCREFSDGIVAPAFWTGVCRTRRRRRLQGGQHRRFDDRSPHPAP